MSRPAVLRLLETLQASEKAVGVERLPLHSDLLGRLIQLALNGAHPWISFDAGWALAQFPLVPEGRGHFGVTSANDEVVWSQGFSPDLPDVERELISLIVAWYRRQPWTDAELVRRLQALKIESYRATQLRLLVGTIPLQHLRMANPDQSPTRRGAPTKVLSPCC